MIEQPMPSCGRGPLHFLLENQFMPRHYAILSIVMALAAATIAAAADKAGEKSSEDDIRGAIAALEGSFNRGDVKSLAACWTPEGDFLGPSGERIVGREKIGAAFRDFFAAHPTTKLRLNVASWRLLTDNVAMVELVPQMTPIPDSLEAEPASSVVLVKRDGKWLIENMHEAVGGEPSHRVHLMGLAWLVGDWAAESAGEAGVAVRSTCDWTNSGNFLIRKFTVEAKKKIVRGGTEVIGWDARNRRIRSWTFDSDGGFGESVWTRDGGHWIVAYTGTRADGGDVTATHVVTLADANTLTIRSKDHVVDGQKQPDMPEVTLKRRPVSDEPKTKPSVPAKPRHVLP
jgi:uncharacterized protein (TIGR02246 family)